MVHTSIMPLPGQVGRSENPFPTLTNLVRKSFLDLVAPHRPSKMLPLYEAQGKFLPAAECAIQLKDYPNAFRLYERAIAQGNIDAPYLIAELARDRKDHQRALRYDLRTGNLIEAGFDELQLHHPETAFLYWTRVAHGEG